MESAEETIGHKLSTFDKAVKGFERKVRTEVKNARAAL